MTREEARLCDQQDVLSGYRQEFNLIKDTIYMDGNSLGLFPKRAEKSLLDLLETYKDNGINLWSMGSPPYFIYQDKLATLMAPLMGARPHEVTLHANTTVNIHSMLATLYHPKGKRRKILVDDLNFPTGRYAIESHLRMRGLDPEEVLLEVKSQDGQTLDEKDLTTRFDDEVALAFLPSVLYRSGQLLDMPMLTKSAHEKGVLIGFDCSHSAGSVPHHLSEDGVDFAVWCTYKYLNGGPGATAGLFLHERHHHLPVGMAGWQGVAKDKQFDLLNHFEPTSGAGAWQTGTQNLFSMAPLEGSLGLFHEAGFDALRKKSLALTQVLLEAIDGPLATFGFTTSTPRQDHKRGGHVALQHPEAVRINQALKDRGVLPDFRAPDVIRLAPTAFYGSFEDTLSVIEILVEIMESGSYKKYDAKRGTVA